MKEYEEFFLKNWYANQDAVSANERDSIVHALRSLRKIVFTTCREWEDGKFDRCGAPAEFILWGKLIRPEGLGPRCYDHARMHVGDYMLGYEAAAIVDLRPGQYALRALDMEAERGSREDVA